MRKIDKLKAKQLTEILGLVRCVARLTQKQFIMVGAATPKHSACYRAAEGANNKMIDLCEYIEILIDSTDYKGWVTTCLFNSGFESGPRIEALVEKFILEAKNLYEEYEEE